MNRLGKVLHLSSSKNLILRTKNKIQAKTPVLDEELHQVGIIFDVFGPVNNPYISIKPTINNAERYVGHFLYTEF